MDEIRNKWWLNLDKVYLNGITYSKDLHSSRSLQSHTVYRARHAMQRSSLGHSAIVRSMCDDVLRDNDIDTGLTKQKWDGFIAVLSFVDKKSMYKTWIIFIQ